MTERSINIAILAIGGQGGGVMAEWVVELAERGGYLAQYTSVPGVAQRTGATIYYIEIFPEAAAKARGGDPVLALMPMPGDVDIVIASELMEAGRAMQRGLVTPDRTTLIASTHRVFAISEKSAMSDGRSDGSEVMAAAEARARRFVHIDMDAAARDGGSVISAAMFGALAGSGALPFPRSLFEAVIRDAGRAVAGNLATFALAHDGAAGNAATAAPASTPVPALAKAEMYVSTAAAELLDRIERLPFIAQQMATEGLRRVVDYQDVAYGSLYLDRLAAVAVADHAAGGERQRHELIIEAARHLALWMSFEDIFRVADLKTRSARFARFRGEVKAAPQQIVDVTEFMHPRLDEICDSLPAPIGRAILGSPLLKRAAGRLFQRGRRIRTTSLGGFLLLYILAAGRRMRRTTLRFRRESVAIEAWLARIIHTAAIDYRLAVEIAVCQKLIKGYGDTHARGAASFARLMDASDRSGATPGFDGKLRQLREAALADESGAELDAALDSLRSFNQE